VLDALKNGDRNGNRFIELVAHVQDQVPRIAVVERFIAHIRDFTRPMRDERTMTKA
jgi:hypothetical protein